MRVKGELADNPDGLKCASMSPLKSSYDAPSIDATSDYRRARGCGRRSFVATFCPNLFRKSSYMHIKLDGIVSRMTIDQIIRN